MSGYRWATVPQQRTAQPRCCPFPAMRRASPPHRDNRPHWGGCTVQRQAAAQGWPPVPAPAHTPKSGCLQAAFPVFSQAVPFPANGHILFCLARTKPRPAFSACIYKMGGAAQLKCTLPSLHAAVQGAVHAASGRRHTCRAKAPCHPSGRPRAAPRH